MRETIPRSLAVWASSAEDQRESGLPDSCGSVQANAVIWARTVEGKKARGARTWRFCKDGTVPARRSPFADGRDVTPHLTGNRGVVPRGVLISQNEDLRPHHLEVGRLAQTSEVLKSCIFLSRKSYDMVRLGSTGHATFLLRLMGWR